MADWIKLTKRAVGALKTTGKRYSVSDTEIPGFCIRMSATGGRSYGFRYRAGGGRDGRSRWFTIGSHGKITTDQARDIAKSVAAEVAQGGDQGIRCRVEPCRGGGCWLNLPIVDLGAEQHV